MGTEGAGGLLRVHLGTLTFRLVPPGKEKRSEQTSTWCYWKSPYGVGVSLMSSGIRPSRVLFLQSLVGKDAGKKDGRSCSVSPFDKCLLASSSFPQVAISICRHRHILLILLQLSSCLVFDVAYYHNLCNLDSVWAADCIPVSSVVGSSSQSQRTIAWLRFCLASLFYLIRLLSSNLIRSNL